VRDYLEEAEKEYLHFPKR